MSEPIFTDAEWREITDGVLAALVAPRVRTDEEVEAERQDAEAREQEET